MPQLLMPLKLLLIDDDPTCRDLFSELLGDEEVTLATEIDEAESSRLVEMNAYEGIFLNFGTPGVDSEALARKIRRSKVNRTTPIVMIARKGDAEVLRRGFEAGATFFLPSPVTRHEIQEVLRKSRGTMLDERRRHRRVPFKASIQCLIGEEAVVGHTLDLSESGMAVELNKELAGGTHLRSTFELPPARSIESEIVVRAGRGSRSGVEFTRISSDDRQAIREYVLSVTSTR
jgi:CheY-like chemotaxis protein